MKSKWTVLLALTAVVFFLSHCGSESPVVKTEADATELVDSRALECLSGVYEGTADLRYDWGASLHQKVKVLIAFSGPNALVQVNGGDNDMLCTHYAGVNSKKGKDIVVLSANEITSSRREGTHWLGSDNVAQSFGNIALTFPKAKKAKVNAEAEAQEQATAEQNKCSFTIASLEDVDSTPEANTIDSKKLNKITASADYNALLNACGGSEGLKAFTIKLTSQEDDEEEKPAVPVPVQLTPPYA